MASGDRLQLLKAMQIAHLLTRDAIELLTPRFEEAEDYIKRYSAWIDAANYEITDAPPSMKPCTGVFHAVYRLPCTHRIIELHERGGCVSELVILEHWGLPKPGELVQAMIEGEQWFLQGQHAPNDPRARALRPCAILEPSVLLERITYKNIEVATRLIRQRTTDTQRLPSSHEVLEAALAPRKRAQPTCSTCQTKGHTKRRCPATNEAVRAQIQRESQRVAEEEEEVLALVDDGSADVDE